MKGWPKHINADITPDFLIKYFAPGTKHNLGCVVRPPFIHVDLDSKLDAGASVMAWLATMLEIHRAAKRNDIQRGTSNRRGFMGVRLIDPHTQTTPKP
jgi:hypothetical protein